jgi:hypothetical protein
MADDGVSLTRERYTPHGSMVPTSERLVLEVDGCRAWLQRRRGGTWQGRILMRCGGKHGSAVSYPKSTTEGEAIVRVASSVRQLLSFGWESIPAQPR